MREKGGEGGREGGREGEGVRERERERTKFNDEYKPTICIKNFQYSSLNKPT